MSYYFVHPLRDDGTSFSYQTYPEHDGSNYPNKVDISNLTLGHTNGNRVLSMTNGEVIGVGTFSGGEGYVVVKVTDADAAPIKRIRYIHLNNTNFAVSLNQQVIKGQLLGYVADEGGPGFGNGSGAHLHVDFGTSENGIDFDNFAPIDSSNLVSTNYNETTYNNLCAGRGVSSDINSQYYWPYMLWAQKPQTISSPSGTTRGSILNLGFTVSNDTIYKAKIIIAKCEGALSHFERWQKTKDDVDAAAAEIMIRAFCSRASQTANEQEWLAEVDYWRGNNSPAYSQEYNLLGMSYNNDEFDKFIMDEFNGTSHNYIEKVLSSGRSGVDFLKNPDFYDAEKVKNLTQFRAAPAIVGIDAGATWSSIDLGWLHNNAGEGNGSYLIIGYDASKFN